MEQAPKVLFLDDEKNILNSLKRLFVNDDLCVFTCTNGPDALDILKNNDIAVIISDNLMPGMNGIQFLQQARRITPNSVRIMLTGNAEIQAAVNAINEGEVYKFVTKPWDEDELRNIVFHSIDRYKITLLNEELGVRKTELEYLNEQKNQLIGMIAHDLRNPLTIIMGLGELLELQLKNALSKKQLSYLDRMKSSSLYMVNLINNLLDVRMIESGKLSLDTRQTDIVSLVRESVDFNNILAESKNISINFSYEDPIPQPIIDRLRIEQVLNNLLSNAVKFSQAGSKVWVKITQTASELMISIKDEGLGMPPEDLGVIFEPFTKGSVKPTAGEKSTGLGLAIVKKIVEGHNGSIKVESQVGFGTTFYIVLQLPH